MYKIIIAGCGGISNSWFGPLKKRDDCEIAALVDPMEGRADAKREEHGLECNTYASLAEACKKESADIVVDITPPEYHCETVTTALNAGFNVFGEKPMADNVASAEMMIKCADANKKEYFVMQNYRYNPGIIALRRFLRSGKLGAIGSVSANFQLNPHFFGFRDEMDSPLILDMSIHTFDAARYILGADARTVYCHEFNPSWSWYRGDAAAVCIFEMDDGAVFDYRGCWCATGLITTWNCEWRVACENGVVYWDGGDTLFYDARKEAWDFSHDKVAIPLTGMGQVSHEACIADMFDALKNGARPQTDCRDNIRSIGMVYKSIESSRSKGVVKF